MNTSKGESARSACQISAMNCKIMTYNIAKRLRDSGIGIEQGISFDELIGWAQLGVAMAINKFDPDKLKGETIDPLKRMCRYVLMRGYWIAIDEMRSASVISRIRNGKTYGGSVKLMQVEDQANTKGKKGHHHHNDDPFNVIDERLSDPYEITMMKDMMETVKSKLSPRDAALLHLRYVDDVNLNDIATTMGISTSRAYALHHKMMMRVHKILTSKDSAVEPNCIKVAA